MPKIVDYETKKQEIIEKAKEVFAKRGYYNTNLAHISSRCGMGRTTIYQYFKNKDEIFYYSVEDILIDLQEKVEAIIENDNLTFIEKLKKLVFELTSEYEQNYIFVLLAEIWIILKRENNELLSRLRDYTEGLKNSINKLIVQGIEAKEIKSIDSEGMADTIYSFIESFTVQSAFNNDINMQKKLNSVNLLIDGLRAH
ncbi:TetR/AcrR family transcriptional regulator [Anaerosalibacter massiliensis]|uniref:TetR/AcrR family transcriptional regulator n=1 Tax=Anaerosalibacter massiliensis TaxID=1347392 RepID=A0A9X2S875_9FIRM|nr:TetR/AcrR family transcriptional regulator [Anaerosalibacter massiliensis]MCR2045542.1 TetR/AcrR family transcriptional regulator [Anaerosalibacter massiliensis]